MTSFVPCLLGSLLLVGPAAAEPYRHVRPHGRAHIVGTPARHGEPGFPITAAKDSIRINGVGEVISQPVPVIQKEQNFDNRAKKELSTPQPPQTGSPTQP